MYRFIHTSDWHLGHSLHGFSRQKEHQQFLTWLIQLIGEQQPDGLIMSGDIFDSANPPADAWQAFYRFLAKVRIQFPHLHIVFVGGNHDSPSRLNAPEPLLQELNVHLIGSLSKTANEIANQHIIPLKNKKNQTQAYIAAIPFLRNCDLLALNDDNKTSLETRFEHVYQQAWQQIKSQNSEGLPCIATAHAYLVGGELSPLSERKVLGGNQHAIPTRVFEETFDYVALGHLHLAQKVGGHAHIRYSGSPIPLSMNEHRYPHQVLLVEINGQPTKKVTSHVFKVPRHTEMLVVPAKAQPLAEVLSLLAALPQYDADNKPFLQVNVLLTEPEPLLKEQIVQVLKDKQINLTRIAASYPEQSVSDKSSEKRVQVDLEAMTPEKVFNHFYQQRFTSAPDEGLVNAFAQLERELEQTQ